jgi:hypothetical protein
MKSFPLLVTVLIGFAAAGSAQQPNAPPPPIPTNSYSGYAFADCGPSNAPIVRIMLPAGSTPIPETLPSSPPRPRVEIVVQGGIDRVAGQEVAIAAQSGSEGGPTAVALSCPLMGNCSQAQRGRLMFQRGAAGALSGEFRARWPDEAVRATDVIGRFTAVWFDTPKKCG